MRSDPIAKLVNKPGCVDIHDVAILYTTTEVSSNCILITYVNHLQANTILEHLPQVIE